MPHHRSSKKFHAVRVQPETIPVWDIAMPSIELPKAEEDVAVILKVVLKRMRGARVVHLQWELSSNPMDVLDQLFQGTVSYSNKTP